MIVMEGTAGVSGAKKNTRGWKNFHVLPGFTSGDATCGHRSSMRGEERKSEHE